MAINGVGSWIREQEGEDMEWARTLAYITGTVDQELLLRNEYLVAENRILKAQLKERLRLSDAERAKLGEIGHRLGRKALGGGDYRSAGHHLSVVPKARRSQMDRGHVEPRAGHGSTEKLSN
jgi:hypothetical protein